MSCPFDPSNKSSLAKKDLQVNENEEIPQPPIHWFTRNLPELDPEFPIKSIWRLADVYGPIYKLDLVRRTTVILSSHELISEVCDEDRFEKNIAGGLTEVRALTGDGLFTAAGDEMNWWKAHRVLMPVFGPIAIKKMFADMLDIGSQMVLKWDRQGPNHEISTADDFTRLAFDTIGFCAFSYRFNSFYLEDVHRFANQMADVLTEAGRRSARPAIENQLRIFSAQQTAENVKAMWKLCDDLVAERKAHPQPDSKDLLNTMLTVRDPETDELLSDENIRFNMVTFLVAGHETTSGTLAFMMYHLLKNPQTYHSAQAEVDRVIGDGALEVKHLPQLKYIEACIRETLRFQGPISAFALKPKKDTVIGGKYHISKDWGISCNLPGLHHDPKVWGEDADLFRPERMLDGGFEALPRHAWKPFGNGKRACIGRAFAEQEMIMVTALILQRFQVEMADPSYNLELKSTLTIKPKDFKIRVTRRLGKDLMVGIPGASSSSPAKKVQMANEAVKTGSSGAKGHLTILYGSNAGTCKSLAEDLETSMSEVGYSVKVQTMDAATENIPQGEPVLIITPSYEGKPADNAKKFVTWLESGSANSLKNTQFAVFGVGNSEWTSTFHRIPKLVDGLFEKLGGSRLQEPGFVDVREDLVGPWEDWKEAIVKKIAGSDATLVDGKEIKVEISKPGSVDKLAGQEVSSGIVRKNYILAGKDVGPMKRHVEVELPKDMIYRTGDYLVVLPTNHVDAIRRVLRRFHLHPDDVVSISETNKSYLLGEGPTTAMELIGARVELATPISQRQLQTIAKTASSEKEKEGLDRLGSDQHFKSEVLEKRTSVIDILEDFPSINLSFGAYLDLLKPLSPRQYSISSSPGGDNAITGKNNEAPIMASITFDVHEAPARSGKDRIFQGVASTYLATCPVNDKIRCFVRATNASFHLPPDPEIPVIMICAGTGLAPMRGFIEERAQIAKAGGRKLGKALLYFGCRHHEKDFLYKDQLKEWERLGAVMLRPAFSQVGPEGEECYKYVPDRMWAERDELAKLFVDGAKIFVCGSAKKLAKSSAEVCQKIWLEKNPGKTEEDAFEWLEKQREDRYVSDVFD